MNPDVVIVNVDDLIWRDLSLDPNDINPFFFKEDPVAYLRNLHLQNWNIYLYRAPLTDEELSKYPYRDKQDAPRAIEKKNRSNV